MTGKPTRSSLPPSGSGSKRKQPGSGTRSRFFHFSRMVRSNSGGGIAMNKCPSCQAEVEDSLLRCPRCGAPFNVKRRMHSSLPMAFRSLGPSRLPESAARRCPGRRNSSSVFACRLAWDCPCHRRPSHRRPSGGRPLRRGRGNPFPIRHPSRLPTGEEAEIRSGGHRPLAMPGLPSSLPSSPFCSESSSE